ncbi:MAG TPA: aromatic amino acid transport family protein [Candidatus Limnocylindria bacterium]
MAPEESALFSREELVGGVSARRSTTLLFAIESRTAHLLAGSQVVPIVLSERAAAEREHAYLEALAQGRDLPHTPTIQELERHAPAWADLVPPDPATRAGVAHLLGEKHVVPYGAVPRLRAALGLDSDAVQLAHGRVFGAPLETIYAPSLGLADRLRWWAAGLAGRLDALPAFWLAFVVTLIIGAVNLALPIAVAGVGALPGVVLIVALGIVNMVTIAAMAEVVTRSGSIRYRNAFIGTVVADYLGGAGSAILSLVLTAFSFGILLIFYVGISTTLADATSLPAAVWMLVLFGVGLYFLTRGSLNATLASTIVITTINVVLLLVLAVMAFANLRLENLAYVNLPWSADASFEPIVLGALVGVILDIYAAHILVAIFGRTLLQKDPSGRSVVRGHVSGIGFAMVLNVVWVLAVCGAIAPEVLASQSSTVVVPLAAEIGPAVRVLGAIFVILSMGLGLIQFSLALFNLARERIGQRSVGGGSRGRFLLALTPLIGVLLVAEWMVLTGTGSFAGILGFLGVMVHSLMSGIFPVLLLVASRRKGELVPGVSYRALGHPVVVGGIYLLFLSTLFVHGLVIWDEPLMRVGGVAMGLLVLVVTAGMVRRGAFAPRVVVELRQDLRAGEPSLLNVTAGGRPAAAEVQLNGAGSTGRIQSAATELPELATLTSIGVDLPSGPAHELKVWAHSISGDGASEPLPIVVGVSDGDQTRTVDIGQSDGQAVLGLTQQSCHLELSG